MNKRAVALIDGFNFYHPIKHHQRSTKTCLLWLNYRSLLEYYATQSPAKSKHQMGEIYFFTAVAEWREAKHPGSIERHVNYINALKSVNVEVVKSPFKEKRRTLLYDCEASQKKPCTLELTSHEEKETDVRIACKLLELAALDTFDICYLLSADSDLVPAVETMNTLYPKKQVILVTPPSKAKITKLRSITHHHIKVSLNNIKAHQFPDEMTNVEGYKLFNPWKVFPQSQVK